MQMTSLRRQLNVVSKGFYDEHSSSFQDAALKHKATRRHEFDELVIVATAIVILVAGYDTTGTTLAFAIYELSKNPDVQERLRNEVEDIVGDAEEITYDHIQSMTYLDQVISETLRFHTPIPFTQRATSKPYKIPGNETCNKPSYQYCDCCYCSSLGSDLVLEEDFQIWINVSTIHFDPKHYPDPHKFNPEHFNKENKANRHPYAFQSFGQGPRGCVGMRFALLEAKLALANIVKRYNLLPSPKTKEPLELDPLSGIAYVKGGLFLKAEKL